MRAAVYDRYGPPEVVTIREMPMPEVGPGDVLIRVNAASVTIADARIRAMRVPRGLNLMARASMGLFCPRNKILGLEVAGIVERVGRDVTGFKPGDRVVGSRGFKMGGHAEFMVVPAKGSIAKVPDAVSDIDAVAVLFGGSTVLMFDEVANLKPGEAILINGASGAVGTMAVQHARHRGATVTAVCSGANAALVKSLGADHVIDYTREDFAKTGARYDLVADNVGNAPYARIRHLLKPGGRFLMVIADLSQPISAIGKKDIVNPTSPRAGNFGGIFRELLHLTAKGYLRPVIDSVYPFEDIAKAHARVDTGRKVGATVVTMRAPA